MQGVKREESCSRRLCQGNNNGNKDDTEVVKRPLLSNSVEQISNDMRDGKGGVAAVLVATGYDNGNKAGCWRALGCNVELPMSTPLVMTATTTSACSSHGTRYMMG